MKKIIIVEIPDEFKKSYADITIFEDEPPYGITERIEYLKPLPQKKVSSLVVDGEKVNSAYEEGWNDCLDEILGEEENGR